MPAAIKCMHQGKSIGVDRAVDLWRANSGLRNSRPSFLCLECGKPVRPHRGGGNSSAHFEHLMRNPDCSLSHRKRDTLRSSKQGGANYALDDRRAIEGYELDGKNKALARNSNIVIRCKKRDNYTCQACGFRLRVSGHFVIECHHTKPLAFYGEREVSIGELVCLCPTCHRIAHTRKDPFSVQELKALLNR